MKKVDLEEFDLSDIDIEYARFYLNKIKETVDHVKSSKYNQDLLSWQRNLQTGKITFTGNCGCALWHNKIRIMDTHNILGIPLSNFLFESVEAIKDIVREMDIPIKPTKTKANFLKRYKIAMDWLNQIEEQRNSN